MRTKTKSSMFLLICLILLSILIWMFNFPTTHLKSFVSKTQLHIKNINSKLQVLDEIPKRDLDVESTYLELLGFVDNPKLYKNDNDTVNRLPTFVTAFKHFTDKEKYLIESKLKYFPNHTILIYDIDLSFSEQLKIKKLCNVSCTLKTFKAEKYPNHIMESKLKSYKPIIIQEVLNEYGILVWVEAPNVFISNKIDDFISLSKSNGLVIWPSIEPITQMTHPSMFKHFGVDPKEFYFVHMLDSTLMIIVNNENIHNKLMLPWVKCALKQNCIAPPGSQLNGCNFNRRPEFLYSGCHRYESSSFSIITALLFNFDSGKYMLRKNQTFCASIDVLLQSTTQYQTTSVINANSYKLMKRSNNKKRMNF